MLNVEQVFGAFLGSSSKPCARHHNNIIKWTTSERLFGVQVDNKMTWSKHAANVAKSLASKLSLLRRMRFLPRKQLEDFYMKVILPSVTYGL